METVTDFIFLDFKITADGDCSHEIKRCLFLGRKAMTNLDKHIKKQRHYFANKGLVKAMVFLVITYGCEHWNIKKAPKNLCFRTLVLEKTLESPVDSKEIKPVNPKKKISPEYSLEVKAETPIFWLPDVKSQLIRKDLMLGKIESRRRKGWQRTTRWLDGITDSMDMSLSKLGVGDGQGSLACCRPWGHKDSDTTD